MCCGQREHNLHEKERKTEWLKGSEEGGWEMQLQN